MPVRLNRFSYAAFRFFIAAVLITVAHPQTIDVSRETAASISSATADSILGQVNNSIQVAPGTCLLTLHRDSPISVFSLSGSTVNSDADMASVCQESGYVKVIGAINYCGQIIPNVVGCAYRPGTCIVVVRYDPSLEWMLWAHEYGHSKGLDHREDSDAIMNHQLDPSHVSMTGFECGIVQNAASGGPQGPPSRHSVGSLARA